MEGAAVDDVDDGAVVDDGDVVEECIVDAAVPHSSNHPTPGPSGMLASSNNPSKQQRKTKITEK